MMTDPEQDRGLNEGLAERSWTGSLVIQAISSANSKLLGRQPFFSVSGGGTRLEGDPFS